MIFMIFIFNFVFQTMICHFVILTFDRYSRDEIIGEVFIPLNSLDLLGQENINIMLQKDIQPRSIKVEIRIHDCSPKILAYHIQGDPFKMSHPTKFDA